ncbi:MAG: hypothetical protein RI900_2837 [Actinomycetota bacterium]
MFGRLVAADDRTGAFEAAAWLAEAEAPVTVWVGAARGDGVVDIGTRHCSGVEAAARVSALPSARWRAHKTDSLLRGNWPAELRALGGRVLFVPAWPEMGRVCVNGVVYADGVRVGVVGDGLPESRSLTDESAVVRWLDGGEGVGVADVCTAEQMQSVVGAASGYADVVVAGPAGAIGAAHVARFGEGVRAPAPALAGSAMVVNGSASPVAHEQVARLRSARPDIGVWSVPAGATDLRPEAAQGLAERASRSVVSASTVVVIGGDTAAALLADEPRLVGGFVAAGMPWSRDEHGGGPLVISKAGAFGGADALVALFAPS